MKPDTPPTDLRYFLTDNLYLLPADKEAYLNPPDEATHTAVAETPAPVIETPDITFKYLGGNQKNYLILCHYPGADHMDEVHLTALTNTLARLQLAINDVAILNMAPYPNSTWEQLVHFFNPQKLLVLGKQALPAELPALHVNEVNQLDKLKALYTFSFNEMVGQKENTKLFWNQIQAL